MFGVLSFMQSNKVQEVPVSMDDAFLFEEDKFLDPKILEDAKKAQEMFGKAPKLKFEFDPKFLDTKPLAPVRYVPTAVLIDFSTFE